jgi:hypothetical protein
MVVQVSVAAATSKYSDGSPQWRAEVADLHRSLTGEAEQVSARGGESEGNTRGTAVEIIAVLGSSGAIGAAVACFRMWLGRDKTRSLDISWTDADGKPRRVTLAGENLDQKSFQSLADSIGRSLEGP